MNETTSYLNIEAVQAHENVEARDYWNSQLKGSTLIPCFDRCTAGRSTDSQPYTTEKTEVAFPFSISDKLHALAPSAKAAHVLLLGAMGLLARRFTSSGDPVIFTIDPDTENELPDTASLLPISISGVEQMNSRDYLLAMREQFVNAVNHARYPLTRKLQLTSAQLQTIPVTAIIPYQYKHTAVFDSLTAGLILYYETGKHGLLVFEYNTALFSEEMIQTLAGSYLHLLHSMLSDMDARTDSFELIDEDAKIAILSRLDNLNVNWPRNETLVSLIEKQAALLPENIAVSFEQKNYTYSDINAWANQFAAMLRAHGIIRNQVVGLLMDRNVEMLVAMLGILKAGGAYLPIDPDYPVDRKNYLVEDSKTTCVVTTRTYAAGMQQSELFLYTDEIDLSGYGTENLPAVNAPDDLCYIIYTSGTTGNPKGVMISHYNVVRLLFNDCFQFDFSAADVWTMFHSHCFDFSVWEIYGALCYGSRLIIIPKMIARDTEAFLKLLRDEKVTVLNQTPSAFYNLVQEELASVSHTLSLRYVIFGGEALSPGKLSAWRQHYPLVKLINMFGITETTVHVTYKEIGAYEIEHNISNIGTPIPTLAVYIMDSYGKLLPAGCTGELYVGGAGVAKGYLGKDELTKQKFITHPYLPGERVYRSGDLARILPSGDLEYLGRMDEQVKIRGFRIELGEIEYQVSQYPGVQKCAVIAQEEDGQKYLAGYFVADTPITSAALREYLQARLPDYMVPSFLVQLTAIPLTTNGKLDRRSLPVPKAAVADDYVAPEGIKETKLCAVWQKVLGVERIGVTDNFFSAGGDSIKSIQIISRMRAEGYDLSVKDIFTQQTIRALATAMRERHTVSDQSEISGPGVLSPVQLWFFSQQQPEPQHYNQSVLLEFPSGLSRSETERVFSRIQSHHDALRTVFIEKEGRWESKIVASSDLPLSITEYDLRGSTAVGEEMERSCNELQRSVNLSTGPLLRLGLIQLDAGSRLLVVLHHLAVDGVSWRILLEDMDILLDQQPGGKTPALPPKTDSFRSWSSGLRSYMTTREYMQSRRYWDEVLSDRGGAVLPVDNEGEDATMQSRSTVMVELDVHQTDDFIKRSHTSFGTGADDLLLSALQLSVEKMYGIKEIWVDMEGHGREETVSGSDISRTVGWFTSIYPVLLRTEDQEEKRSVIRRLKEQLRGIPNRGMDYLIYKYLDKIDQEGWVQAEISYNYLGQFDTDTSSRRYRIGEDSSGDTRSMRNRASHKWEVTCIVSGGKLRIIVGYSSAQYTLPTMERFAALYKQNLEELIRYCIAYGKQELTPSDLTYPGLSVQELDVLQARYAIADVYPLSPMQEGLFFHSLLDENPGAYFEQILFTWEGALNHEAVQQAFDRLALRYTVLRTAFIQGKHKRPLQVVVKQTKLGYDYRDIREELKNGSEEEIITSFRNEDRKNKFQLDQPGLMRVRILRTGENRFKFIWSHHHIIMDGWCMGLVVNDFAVFYQHALKGLPVLLKEVAPYSAYIAWLEKQDRTASAEYWKNVLHGYDNVVEFPRKTGPKSYQPERQAVHSFELGVTLTNRLKDISSRHGVTLNMLMQTIWGILAARYNNCNDVIFGSVVSGRPGHITGIEQMVGLFINTIPIRVKFSREDTFMTLLQQVKENAIASEPYHYHPLAEVQSFSQLKTALINHILVFENYPVAEAVAAGQEHAPESYRVTDVQVFEQTNYDLSVMMIPGGSLSIKIHYNETMYDGDMIQRLADHLIHLTSTFTSDINSVITATPLLSETEKSAILAFNSAAAVPVTDSLVIDLFEKIAGAYPAAIAVQCGPEQISYQELNNKADKLAGLVYQQKALQQNDIIAFYADPSINTIVAMLAILKLGCTYLALGRDVPAARNRMICTDAAVRILIISDTAYLSAGEEFPVEPGSIVIASNDGNPTITTPPVYQRLPAYDNIIYVLYTSGTTGLPKGVQIRTSGILNTIQCFAETFSVKPGTKVSQVANILFDASANEIWPCLTRGGELHIAPAEVRMDINLMEQWLIGNQVEVSFQPPAIAEMLLRKPDFITKAGLSALLVAGDVFNYEMNEHLPFRLYNLYGPTEDSVWTTYKEVLPGQHAATYSIGRPITNKQLFILDQELQLLPVNTTGELYISGFGLAKGYLNKPELTRQKFIPNPYLQGQLMYRTGDLARWTNNGEIEFIGRKDFQVKIRGFRIETGDIESAILSCPGILQAAVVTYEQAGQKNLAAYFTADKEIPISELRLFLYGYLPLYMIPAYFLQLKQMPYNASGKIERKNLPAPVFAAKERNHIPENNLYKQLIEIWSGVLGMNEMAIDIRDNFFDIGGNSILLMQMVNEVNSRFSTDISVASIFRLPFITHIAEHISGHDEKQPAFSTTNAGEKVRNTLSALEKIRQRK